MEITVKITTENDSFQGANLGPQVAWILRGLATRAERSGGDLDGLSVPLRDENGNTCGAVTITEA